MRRASCSPCSLNFCEYSTTAIASNSSPSRNFIPITPEVALPIGRSASFVAVKRRDIAFLLTSNMSSVSETKAAETTEASSSASYIEIKSPMIGTFYRRASPDKPLLAEEGTEVNSGKVVCIIEAMKLFNEIESEVKGTIVKVLVEDASPVEYDQPLFLVQPA